MKCDDVMDVTARLSTVESALNSALDVIQHQSLLLEQLQANDVVMFNDVEILKKEVFTLEQEVMPGHIAASCEELRTRGETQNGKFLIQPAMESDPFWVTCRFRKRV